MTDLSAGGEPLRIGILSTANIGRHFAAGVKGSETVVVAAVASRGPEKAEGFAERNGIPRALGSYEALLDHPEIEAVYNPLPNTMHAEWTIRALEAGKHVLCEKPIAVTTADARAMFDAARHAGRLLVEAFPYRSQPQTLALARLLASGEIGQPRMIQGIFGFPVADPANIRLNPALGGGALLDAGSYPVSLIRMIAGARATRVSATATWAPSGVDQSLAATFEFPDGLIGQAACAFGVGLNRRAIVACTEGLVETDYLNHLTPEAPGEMLVGRGGWTPTREAMRFEPMNGFRAEAESFTEAVRAGPDQWNGIGEAESIDVMLMLEAAIASAKSGQPVAIG